jgi:hypothetical protein
MFLLSTVEAVFSVQGRGCVVVPVELTNTVRVGDAIQFELLAEIE